MITQAILNALQAHLEAKLITEVDEDDTSRAGVVKIGPLQGEPDVDVARISVEIYANDPEDPDEYADEIVEWEMPRTAIWSRRFVILWRALLADTGEDLSEAWAIASAVKSRLEFGVNTVSWAGIVSDNGETVMGCPLHELESSSEQGGGPGEHDFSGKLAFDVWTRQAYR